MVRSQNWIPGKPVVVHASRAMLAAARRDARKLGVGWVLVWTKNPVVVRYLADTGFRLDYQADGVAVYRPA
jgi:ribose 1,5-bisphosphokinase PhnN